MKKILFSIIFYAITILAQVPQPALNPMTAPGAIGIDNSEHTLFWENPSGVQYNECYFSTDSSLVADLDTTVRIQNGYPSTIDNSVTISSFSENTKYFWSVVEYNASGNSSSPVWYFYSQPPPLFVYESYFENDLEGWEIAGPLGFNNWHWLNSTHTGASPGEMAFFWDPVFIGDSYIMSPEIPCPAGATVLIEFRYFEDWWSDTVVVGSAITSDNGNSWTSIWELHASGNVGPDIFYTTISAPGNFRLGFYYTGDSNNIDFLYVDDVWLATPITIPYPPSFLQAQTSSTEQKVTLSWNAGIPLPPPTGYRIQRKEGLPLDNSLYVTLTETNYSTFTFDDENVKLNQNYTYRISTLNGSSSTSHYGNEATAYVPAIVPVELQSFTAEVINNDVKLIWSTATETNNSGFEILRSTQNDNYIWQNIGFVPGFGTTTEIHNYSYVDKSLQPGNYQYRLKQIDFEGTFEYSNIFEISIDAPEEFSLEQNYPNPFNPVTKIKYEIPGQARNDNAAVTLKVYDVLGDEVATLVNEEKPLGTYEVDFDATGLPSGIYFYQLKAGSFVETKKMVLLR